MRYVGSILAMLTLLAAAWAGSIDNSATRNYVGGGSGGIASGSDQASKAGGRGIVIVRVTQ